MTEEKLPHPCIVCNALHNLDECKEYLKKSLAERRALITKKGLCYACYKPGHRSRGCTHPTGLHDVNFKPRNKQQNDNPKKKNNESVKEKTKDNNLANPSKNCACAVAEEVVCDASNMKRSVESLPIVPVRLKTEDKEIITYAMLDSCSTGTFITEDALR